MKTLYVIDKIDEENKTYLNNNPGVSSYVSKGDFTEIIRYVKDNNYDCVVTPCDYIATVLTRFGFPTTYICRHLIKMDEGKPLEKMVMENYVIREANEVIYDSDTDKAEAEKRYLKEGEEKRELKKNLILFIMKTKNF